MLLVSLSMPAFAGPAEGDGPADRVSAELAVPGWGALVLHTLAVTALANAGKMFPLACNRREVPFRERFALAVAMWPRGEVGAGVLVLGVSYGLGGPIVAVACFSLALNLLLTGPYILLVKRLIPDAATEDADCPRRAPAAGRG